MSNIQIFKNSRFGEVRVAEIEGKTYFVGSDVARALGYSNPYDAIIRHCKSDGVVNHEVIDSIGRKQNAKFINEGNIYRLAAKSELPGSEEFESWIFDEVLPSIRKTGGYMSSTPDDTEESIMARALVIAQSTIERNRMQLQQANATIMEQAPKVEYYERCIESKGYLTVNMIAAELGISSIKLNKLLCDWCVQYRQTDCYFLYSEYRGNGYTAHRPHAHLNSLGIMVTTQHMYWTEAGKKFIIDLYRKRVAV
jgi:prophage antirepressor-like protein